MNEHGKYAFDAEDKDVEKIREALGRHVVVIFRKGGRIKEERRYDSESDSREEVMGLYKAICLFMPIGLNMIGKGAIGFLPWEMGIFERAIQGNAFTDQERFNCQSPVRVADVVENEQTGITTVYLESV